MGMPFQHITLLGFGEVGGLFGAQLAQSGRHVKAYDPLFQDPGKREQLLAKATSSGVEPSSSTADAVSGADLVIVATTCSSALGAAREAAAFLQPGQVYLDLNSVSPETKREIYSEIKRSKADFIESAVMAAVKADGIRTPMLLGGERAEEVSAELNNTGLRTTAVGTAIGVASAIKMCRSVVIKGMAALAIESLFTARRYGAEDAVLRSWDETFPSMGWLTGLPDLLVLRSVEHSKRRAAELREVAETVERAGLTPRMAPAAADMQDWLTAQMDAGSYTFRRDQPFSWKDVADAMLQATSVSERG